MTTEHVGNSIFGVRDIPYQACVADVLLKGDWELYTVKIIHEPHLRQDCGCCGHKHLVNNYWLIKAGTDLPFARQYIMEHGLNKNTDNNVFLCVGSECVRHILQDDTTESIMKGVESKALQVDRQFKDKILHEQAREYLTKNLKRFTDLHKKVIEKEIVEKKAYIAKQEALGKFGGYINEHRARRASNFFPNMLRNINGWTGYGFRKKINEQLKKLGCKKNTLVKTPKLVDADKEKLRVWKEEQMQIYIEGRRKIFEGKYKDMKWCSICRLRVPMKHIHPDRTSKAFTN